MAAQALVRATYRDPVETYAVNVMGLVHLLDAVRRTDSVRVIVNVTSDKCYENREWLWAYREDEPMGGYDPYSSSKGCAELVTSVWRRSFFAGESVVALASARAGNVIGGDWAEDRIVPDCVRAFSAGKPLVLRNPGAVRPGSTYWIRSAALSCWPNTCSPAAAPTPKAGTSGHQRPTRGRLAITWRSSPATGIRQPGASQTGSSRTRPSMQDRCIEGPGAARVASAAGHRPALDWTAV
jgi:hypothetical protein